MKYIPFIIFCLTYHPSFASSSFPIDRDTMLLNHADTTTVQYWKSKTLAAIAEVNKLKVELERHKKIATMALMEAKFQRKLEEDCQIRMKELEKIIEQQKKQIGKGKKD